MPRFQGVAGKSTGLGRQMVLRYSIRNRRRKGEMIAAWMDANYCQTILYVGVTGAEDDEYAANSNIVEKRVAVGRQVIAGFNIYRRTTIFPYLIADGCEMPFLSNAVDFALSSAIIEHVGGDDEQRRFVAEHSRVARCWTITTPNKWFPIESHTSTIVKHWSPRWRASRKEFTRLLSLREFKRLLPDGTKVVGHPWSPTFTAFYAAASKY
jgi:hypothetical protein